MPTYEYKCENNAEHIQKDIRSITAEEPTLICTIEECAGKMIRIFNAPPIEFKGGGWSTKESWR
jgi:predicted nucleic acid-binding Zn ribbon protein